MKDLHYVCFTPNLAYIPHLERCVKGLLKRVGRPDQIQLVFLMHQEVTKKHREPLLEMIESFGAPAPIVKYPELELNLDFRTEDGNNVLLTRSQTPFYRLFLLALLPEADQCLYLDIDIACHRIPVPVGFANFFAKISATRPDLSYNMIEPNWEKTEAVFGRRSCTMKLIGKLKDNVANTETKEEVKQLIEDAGMFLDDQELDQVCGGERKNHNKIGLDYPTTLSFPLGRE